MQQSQILAVLVALTGALPSSWAQGAAVVPAVPAAGDVARLRIVVQGSVARPGVYQVEAGARLADVIALAGGLNVKPETVQVTVRRGQQVMAATLASELLTQQGLEHPVVLQTDDIVVVAPPRSINVIILGQVKQPGGYSIGYHTNLQDLIERAGGVTEGALTRKIAVSRRAADTRVDAFDALRLNGPRLDFPLEDGDVVSIPSNPNGFYILGQVKSPGFHYIPESGHLTLLQAIQLAGGLRRQPEGRHVKITVSHRLPNGGLKPDLIVPPNLIPTLTSELHPNDVVIVEPIDPDAKPEPWLIPPPPLPFSPPEEHPAPYLWFIA